MTTCGSPTTLTRRRSLPPDLPVRTKGPRHTPGPFVVRGPAARGRGLSGERRAGRIRPVHRAEAAVRAHSAPDARHVVPPHRPGVGPATDWRRGSAPPRASRPPSRSAHPATRRGRTTRHARPPGSTRSRVAVARRAAHVHRGPANGRQAGARCHNWQTSSPRPTEPIAERRAEGADEHDDRARRSEERAEHRSRRGSGAWENRTPDILLAKQALYQLS